MASGKVEPKNVPINGTYMGCPASEANTGYGFMFFFPFDLTDYNVAYSNVKSVNSGNKSINKMTVIGNAVYLNVSGVSSLQGNGQAKFTFTHK